jgi:crotonobetainyl-CoA:carnitine CoA-transferase CaiB-like acyl-CoA transferase
MAPYESFRAADREIVIAVTNDKSWASLGANPDFAHLREDPRFADQPARNRARDAVVGALAAIFPRRTAAEWLALLDSAGIPAEPVNRLEEVAHPAPSIASARASSRARASTRCTSPDPASP